jgi:hypothetical protein
MQKIFTIAAVGISALFMGGCWSSHEVKVDSTHEIKPIHITIDINIKVDRALDDFFGDIDE